MKVSRDQTGSQRQCPLRIEVEVFGDTTARNGVDPVIGIKHFVDDDVIEWRVAGFPRFSDDVSGSIKFIGLPLIR